MNETDIFHVLSAARALQKTKKRVLIALDGKSAAGKSTLASLLKERLVDANVYHMDDFFLPPDQKTPQRLSQPGGNVDYERVYSEIILPLTRARTFSYRPFNCHTGRCCDPVFCAPQPYEIIEGAYSQHPFFQNPYALRVFLDIDPQTQKARILARNGQEMLTRFLSEWIPLENTYFDACGIKAHSDIILTQ